VSIFDNQLFVRNLFVGSADASGNGKSVNYYIELELVDGNGWSLDRD